MLPVPHRHRALLQPGGRLSLFYQLVVCFWLVKALFLAIVAEGRVPGANLSTLLEAPVLLFKVFYLAG